MNTANNGGPAFPAGECYELKDGWRREEGMTLRDYFAAKAMQGLLACPGGDLSASRTASDAYVMADAMLRARGAA